MNKYIKALAGISLIVLASQECFSAVIKNYDQKMQTALSLRTEGKSEEAKKIYSEIIAASPDDVDALVGRGFCLIRNKTSFIDAENDFHAVIEIAPSYVDAYYGLALIYKRSGQWNKALRILETAAENCSEEKGLGYLSDISWRIGHLSLARAIDVRPLSQSTRMLKGYTDELYLSYTYDSVQNRSDWHQGGATYVHHPRPDLNMGASFFKYRRNNEDDGQLGLSLSYRHNINWDIGYQNFFSTERNFLARQKHHTMFHYSLASSTLLGVGLRFDEYDDGWAKVGRFDFRQYVHSFYAEYSLLAGHDSFDRAVATHIVRVGYEGDDKLSAHIGYARGDETIEQAGGASFSDQNVESLFLNLKYFFSPKWGIILAGGPEYRDSELFRTTAASSAFLRF